MFSHLVGLPISVVSSSWVLGWIIAGNLKTGVLVLSDQKHILVSSFIISSCTQYMVQKFVILILHKECKCESDNRPVGITGTRYELSLSICCTLSLILMKEYHMISSKLKDQLT